MNVHIIQCSSKYIYYLFIFHKLKKKSLHDNKKCIKHRDIHVSLLKTFTNYDHSRGVTNYAYYTRSASGDSIVECGNTREVSNVVFTAHFSRHHNFSTIIHHGHIKIYVHVYETDFDTLFYIKYTFECFLSDFKDVISSVCISV